MKVKMLCITCTICLLPILLGVSLWDRLPERMAIHFDIYGNPDNFASKAMVVFGLPVLMAVLQGFCMLMNAIAAKKHGEQKKFEAAVQWIVPCMSVLLQIATLGFGLGWDIDIRRVAVLIVGIVFLVIGNFMPKLSYVDHMKMSGEEAKRVNRFMGFAMVLLGVLFLLSLLFPPEVSMALLVLMVPYMLLCSLWALWRGKRP